LGVKTWISALGQSVIEETGFISDQAKMILARPPMTTMIAAVPTNGFDQKSVKNTA